MGGEAHRYLLRRDGMQSISTEGGVGRQSVITQGGVRERERERERETIATQGGGCNGKRYWLM